MARETRQGWLKGRYWFYIICALLFLGGLVWFWWVKEKHIIEGINEIEVYYESQRSTLWPLLISLIATLLGSLITTYVFLKESLDRMVDERPYYSEVVKTYRDKTMWYLWCYSIGTLLLMGFIVFLYIMYYFFSIRVIEAMKLVISAFYVISMCATAHFLYLCINTNYGLSKAIEAMMSKIQKEVYSYIDEFKQNGIDAVKLPRKNEALEEWLQIEESYTICCANINKKRFINRFSEWEKILMMLIEKGENFFSKQSTEEQIRIAIQNSQIIYKPYKAGKSMEDDDAKENEWYNDRYEKIREVQRKFDITEEKFCEIYVLLARYRDLLQVEQEVGKRKGTEEYTHIEKSEEELAQIFTIFLVYMSTRIVTLLPKIEIFFPAGKFQYVNFYTVRFENSSFRASLFENGIFSRSNIKNSNFAMSKFENCELFNVDCRDCSFSNTLFVNCNFKEGILENVDFTGTQMEACELRKVSFNDSILSNMEIINCRLGQNNLTNSKIWGIRLQGLFQEDFSNSNFSNSEVHNVKILVDRKKWKYKEVVNAKTAKRYLKFVLDPELAKYYWTDEKIECNIKKKVQKLIIGEDDFLQEQVRTKENGKKDVSSKTIWKLLRKSYVLNMKESIFENAIMSGFHFYRTNLEQSIFISTQLDESQFIGIVMPGCIMNGVNMRESVLCGVNMRSSVLDDGILFRTKCKLVNFEDGSLVNVHASGIHIVNCTFNKSDCSRMDLTKAKLYVSSFRDTILKMAELTDAFFWKVSFENSIADSMMSAYSLFNHCIFKNAYLEQSSFNYTVFRNCDFSYANFSNSAVTNVEFHECDFKESNFRKTCFINARFRNNCNMTLDIFGDCLFINPKFEGENKNFVQILKRQIIKG